MIMNILIGSRAMNYWTGEPSKDSADWDVISVDPIDGTEHHPVDFLNNHRFVDYASEHTVAFNGNILHVCNPVGLAIIKRSHLHRGLSFAKHITHYHRKLMPLVGKFSPEDMPILGERTQLTKEQFPFNHPKLDVTVSEFFDDFVIKKYDHDAIHRVVAFNDAPMYTKMQPNPEMAWCAKDMWDEFSDMEKRQCVAEEALVISIERFLVPSNWKKSYRLSYMKSLEKVCTTLCSGWFRDYAIDNYPAIADLFDSADFGEFKEKILTTVLEL
jgi:hypothetical protein